MDVMAVLTAPYRVPVRLARAFDDLGTLAERARRDPDPVEQARERVDALGAELAALLAVARELVSGGAELTETAKGVHGTMTELGGVAQGLLATAAALDGTAREIAEGGRDLTATARALHVDTRELIDGGARLTAATEQVEGHLGVFRAALPRLLEGLDTVEELEEAVETVAETVEPLQATAAGVGRVTRRLSRNGG
jgi:methyl-accepting chemotaxis protein